MSAPAVEVNGRRYAVPTDPVVVITVDGGDPAYLDDALERGLLPRLAAMLAAGGEYRRGTSEVPSLTNPNNLSIVTGAPPAVHGIPGNRCRLEDGTLAMLDDPAHLRAPSIHAALADAGVGVLAVTAKEKLRRLLGHGGMPSVSVERAAVGLPRLGLDDLPGLVGTPPPGIYDWDASHYALRLGLVAFRARRDLRLLYISLTDRVQHAAAPGEELSDRFLAAFDALLGDYLDEGFVVAVTADHGMNAKHHPDGSPRVHHLADVLDDAEVPGVDVVLPITDPYVRHHGALGSFAWISVAPEHRDRVRDLVAALPGVVDVLPRDEAARLFELPPDRIGDLAVTAAADTALGRREHEHDLTGLHAPLRSHGGPYDRSVPLIVSGSVAGPLADRFRADGLRNRDIHDLVLNHVV